MSHPSYGHRRECVTRLIRQSIPTLRSVILALHAKPNAPYLISIAVRAHLDAQARLVATILLGRELPPKITISDLRDGFLLHTFN